MKDESEIIRLARPVGDSDHVLGPQQSAPATLIEYGDYECPYCRQLHPIIQEIMRRTEGLRFIYRHFPISKLHPHAMRAAEAAGEKAVSGSCTTCCLNKTSHSMMNASRVAPEKPGSHREGLERDGRRRLRERVDEDFKAALFGGGVTGTPMLYLKEVRLNSIQNLEALLQSVTEAGAILQASSNERTNWLSRLRYFRVSMTRLHLLSSGLPDEKVYR